MLFVTFNNIAIRAMFKDLSKPIISVFPYLLREQPAPTTTYTASLGLSYVTYAIEFYLMRFGVVFPSTLIIE